MTHVLIKNFWKLKEIENLTILDEIRNDSRFPWSIGRNRDDPRLRDRPLIRKSGSRGRISRGLSRRPGVTKPYLPIFTKPAALSRSDPSFRSNVRASLHI